MNDTLVLSVPVVLGLVAAIRQATAMPARFLPLWAVAMGVLLAMLDDGWSRQTALDGLLIGLSASGLYSGTKTVVQG